MAKRKETAKRKIQPEKHFDLSIECPYCEGQADFVEYDEFGRKIYYCYECDIHIISGEE
jgi:transcription elongation factor Elf1